MTCRKRRMKKIITCAAVFSDHCVLQREKEIRVWGTAPHGTKIEVELNGASSETVTQGNHWEVTLPAMEAGGPYVLEVIPPWAHRIRNARSLYRGCGSP